jgi:AcrR family transcriptional regulator
VYDFAMSSVKRSYDSARRQAQAEATRRDVLEAAGELFAARGYGATSIDAIAAQAGVSRETIFKSFGSKRHLLQLWVEQQIAGPDEPVPIAQQQWVELIRESDDRDRQIEIVAAALSAIYSRAIDALVTLRAAAHADPEIAALWQLACDRRREDVAAVTSMLGTDGQTPTAVLDVVYALSSPELFEVLVRQCGWTTERFHDWLVVALTTLAFGPSTTSPP